MNLRGNIVSEHRVNTTQVAPSHRKKLPSKSLLDHFYKTPILPNTIITIFAL